MWQLYLLATSYHHHFPALAAKSLSEKVGGDSVFYMNTVVKTIEAVAGLDTPLRSDIDAFKREALFDFGASLARPHDWLMRGRVLECAAAAAIYGGATPADFLEAAGGLAHEIYPAIRIIWCFHIGWYLDAVVGPELLADTARRGELYLTSVESYAAHLHVANKLPPGARGEVLEIVVRSGPVSFLASLLDSRIMDLNDDEFATVHAALTSGCVSDGELREQFAKCVIAVVTAKANGWSTTFWDGIASCEEKRRLRHARLGKVFAWLEARIDAGTRSDAARQILQHYSADYLSDINGRFYYNDAERVAKVGAARAQLDAINEGRVEGHWPCERPLSHLLSTWVLGY